MMVFKLYQYDLILSSEDGSRAETVIFRSVAEHVAIGYKKVVNYIKHNEKYSWVKKVIPARIKIEDRHVII